MPSFLHIIEGYNREVTTRGFVDRLMGRLHADDTWMEIDPVYSQIRADAHQVGAIKAGRAVLFKDVVFSHPELPKYLLDGCLHWIESLDPTPDRRLCRWLIQKYATAGIKRFEDIPRATESLLQHDRLKKSGFFKRNTTHQEFRKFADSFSFRTLGDLDTFLASLDPKDFMSRSAKRDEEEQRLIDSGQAEVLLDTDAVEIVIPKTKEASCYFGKNTKWCTAGSVYNQFDSYNKRGELYILLLKAKNKRFQFHYSDRQYMDEMDNPISRHDLEALPPEVWKVIDKSYVYVTLNPQTLLDFEEITPRTATFLVGYFTNKRADGEKRDNAFEYFRTRFGGMHLTPTSTVFDEFLESVLVGTRHTFGVFDVMEFPQFQNDLERNVVRLTDWAANRNLKGMIPSLASKFNLWDDFELMVKMLWRDFKTQTQLGQVAGGHAIFKKDKKSWTDLTLEQWETLLVHYPWLYRVCPIEDPTLAMKTISYLPTTYPASWKIAMSRMDTDTLLQFAEEDKMDGGRLNAVLEYYPHEISTDTFYALLSMTDAIKYEGMPEKYKNDTKYQITMLNVMADVEKRWDESIFMDRGVHPTDAAAVVAIALFGSPAWGSIIGTGYHGRKQHEGIDSERLIRILITALKRKGKDNYHVLKRTPGYASQIPDDDWPTIIDAEPIIVKAVEFVPRTGQQHILKNYPAYFKYLPNLDTDIARSILATSKSPSLRQQVLKFLEDKVEE